MTMNEIIQTSQADMSAAIEELSDIELEAVAGGNGTQPYIAPKPVFKVSTAPSSSFPASRSPIDRAQAEFAKQMKAEISPRVHRPQFDFGY